MRPQKQPGKKQRRQRKGARKLLGRVETIVKVSAEEIQEDQNGADLVKHLTEEEIMIAPP